MADDDNDAPLAGDDGFTVILRRPVTIQDKGGMTTADELHFRNPVSGDVFRIGYPMAFISIPGGKMETKIDHAVMQRLLERVCDHPEAVDLIDLGAMQQCIDWLSNEFYTVARVAGDGRKN